MRGPSNRGRSARGAYDDRDLRVRAAQAAGLADGPRELRNRGAQPQAARTHLLGVVLIMVPVYIGLDWLAETWPRESGAQATHRWLREIAGALPSPVDLAFLSSIAVAW